MSAGKKFVRPAHQRPDLEVNKFDTKLQAVTSITALFRLMNDGMVWGVSDFEFSALFNGDSFFYYLVNGEREATVLETHFTSPSIHAEWSLFEDVNPPSPIGKHLVSRRLERNIADTPTSSLQVYRSEIPDGSPIGGGESGRLYIEYYGQNANPRSGGHSGTVWVLKPNTAYMLRLHHIAAFVDVAVGMSMLWYELDYGQ